MFETDRRYPTPPEAVRALLSVETFEGPIWDPCWDYDARGYSAMHRVLEQAGYSVTGDNAERPMGLTMEMPHYPDFLRTTYARAPNLVTNPPYGRLSGKRNRKAAELIIRHALRLPLPGASSGLTRPWTAWK